jgi:hypothetical protein
MHRLSSIPIWRGQANDDFVNASSRQSSKMRYPHRYHNPAPGTGRGASPAARDSRCTIATAETMVKAAGGGLDLPLPRQIR